MFKLACFLLLAFVINVPIPAFAQLGEVPMPKIAPQKEAGPTLEETQQWLKEKVAEFGKYEYRNSYGRRKQEQTLSFNGCELDKVSLLAAYYSVSSNKWDDGSPFHHVVSLADLDIGSISVFKDDGAGDKEAFSVSFHTTGKIKKVKFVVGNKSGDDSDMIYFSVTDVAVAERIKKAMQHAITLCQERALKEAPTQPASKEAF